MRIRRRGEPASQSEGHGGHDAGAPGALHVVCGSLSFPHSAVTQLVRQGSNRGAMPSPAACTEAPLQLRQDSRI